MSRAGRGVIVTATCASLVVGCSGGSKKPEPGPSFGPIPHPVTHAVTFEPEIFKPELLAKKGILTAVEAYRRVSSRDYWPRGVIAQYGSLTLSPAKPYKGVWAFEANEACRIHGGMGTNFAAKPPHKWCRSWDFVDATTGKPVLGIGP